MWAQALPWCEPHKLEDGLSYGGVATAPLLVAAETHPLHLGAPPGPRRALKLVAASAVRKRAGDGQVTGNRVEAAVGALPCGAGGCGHTGAVQSFEIQVESFGGVAKEVDKLGTAAGLVGTEGGVRCTKDPGQGLLS